MLIKPSVSIAIKILLYKQGQKYHKKYILTHIYYLKHNFCLFGLTQYNVAFLYLAVPIQPLPLQYMYKFVL